MLTTQNLIKITLNTTLGVILIFVWLQFVDIKQIILTISNVQPPILALAFLFMLLSVLLRAFRFKLFLSKVKNISLVDMFFLTGIAMMLNFFIPIRGGEIAKGAYLHTNYKLDFAKSLVWVFLDRFVDFLVILILATVLFFIVPTSLNITFVIIVIIILIVALLLTYLILFQSNFTKKLFSFLRPLLILNFFKIYFERVFFSFLNSFSILRRTPFELLSIALITISAYAADGAIWYFIFLSLGSHQDYLKMYLGQILSALTYLIPAAPGYIGSAEASGLLILSGVFGIEPNFSSSMIVLFHLSSAIFILILGIVSLYNLKLDLGDIFRRVFRKR